MQLVTLPFLILAPLTLAACSGAPVRTAQLHGHGVRTESDARATGPSCPDARTDRFDAECSPAGRGLLGF